MERESREPPGRGGGEVDSEMYVHPRLFFTRLDRRHTRETASLFL